MLVLTVWFVWVLRVWGGSLRLLVSGCIVGDCYGVVLLCWVLGCGAVGVCLVVGGWLSLLLLRRFVV